MTKTITAAEVTIQHTLVSANGMRVRPSLISRNANFTFVRVNGQMASLRNDRKVKVVA